MFLISVGEASGKPSRSLAKHIPGTGGLEGVKAGAGGAMNEVAKARIVSLISYKFC